MKASSSSTLSVVCLFLLVLLGTNDHTTIMVSAQIELLAGAAVVAGGVAVVGGGAATAVKVVKKLKGDDNNGKKKKKKDDDETSPDDDHPRMDSPDDDHPPNKKDSPDDDDAKIMAATYGFLFSTTEKNETYCITANNGVRKGAVVELKPCALDDARKSQLWDYNRDSHLIASAKDPHQCLMASNSMTEARIRMAPCDLSDYHNDDALNTFKHNGNQTDKPIRLKNYQSLCLTNLGTNINAGDPIVVGNCPQANWL